MTIELTSEQSAVLARNGEEPVRVVDPATRASFVLLDEQIYLRVKALLAADTDPEALYPRIADIAPEDWEDPAVYGISPPP